MDKRITVISRKAKEPILTASCLWATALHFHGAANVVQLYCPDSKKAPYLKWFKARYFLIGHAIETALKSFLFLNGCSKKNLQNRKGHNLLKALRDAKSKGFLCLNAEEENLIRDLNSHYLGKEFEYEKIDFSKLPLLQDLLELTKKILDEVEKELHENGR